jgi:hypothetical protein
LRVKKAMSKVPPARSVTTESGLVFKIEKGIPISGTFRSLGANQQYPFSKMEIGESFEMKVNTKEIKRRVSNVSSACAAYVKSKNKAAKFTVRRTGPDTLRVWRLK